MKCESVMDEESAEQSGEEQGRQTRTTCLICLRLAALLLPELLYSEGIIGSLSTTFDCGYKLME